MVKSPARTIILFLGYNSKRTFWRESLSNTENTNEHTMVSASRQMFRESVIVNRLTDYPGTSLEAIRTVVSSGKICVLNLHPQSLKLLRASDLKPYVILVSPPSLDVLRQKKVRSGEAFKVGVAIQSNQQIP